METEPDRSGPPPLPRAPDQGDWLEQLAVWRESWANLAQKRHVTRVAAALVAALLAIGFAWSTLGRPNAGPAVESLLPTLDPATLPLSTATPARAIVVHVAGAVVRPGLVDLPPGARVADAVAAAGGVTPESDLDRVNLATLLQDEDRVVIPRIGEEPPVLLGTGSPPSAADGPLDLNRATALQLEELPGIGPATAAAIIGYREDNGPFSSVTALDEVPGIGPAKLAQLRDLVSVRP